MLSKSEQGCEPPVPEKIKQTGKLFVCMLQKGSLHEVRKLRDRTFKSSCRCEIQDVQASIEIIESLKLCDRWSCPPGSGSAKMLSFDSFLTHAPSDKHTNGAHLLPLP